MKSKIKLTSLNRDRIIMEQMRTINGGGVQGSCTCLCDADVKSQSEAGCKKSSGTGCGVIMH